MGKVQGTKRNPGGMSFIGTNVLDLGVVIGEIQHTCVVQCHFKPGTRTNILEFMLRKQGCIESLSPAAKKLRAEARNSTSSQPAELAPGPTAEAAKWTPKNTFINSLKQEKCQTGLLKRLIHLLLPFASSYPTCDQPATLARPTQPSPTCLQQNASEIQDFSTFVVHLLLSYVPT